MDTRILLTIYIFVDHFKMKTDNSSRILGHTDLFPEEKGKRGKERTTHPATWLWPNTCWPVLLYLCLTAKQTNIHYCKLRWLMFTKVWHNWNGNFWERQRITLLSMHQNFWLCKKILAIQTLVLPSQKRKDTRTFTIEPWLSQEWRIFTICNTSENLAETFSTL